MKGHNVANKYGQQRKSSFIDPLNEPAKRKPPQEGGKGTRGTAYIFSPTPAFPHVDNGNDKKHPYKSYDTPNYNIASASDNSSQSINTVRYKKNATPNRLPKLENVSASLKLTSKTEVIEIIAEKPNNTSNANNNNKDIPFHVRRAEVTNTHSLYAKLPNLSSLGLTHNPSTSQQEPNNASTTTKPRFDYKHTDTKQVQDLKQVQDNIQVLHSLHKQQHVNTRNKFHRINSNNYSDNITPTIQNLQEIENIQDNIHQTQLLLQTLQNAEPQVAIRSRNSLEYDESPIKLDRIVSNSGLRNPASILGSYLPRLVFRRFADVNSTAEIESKGTFFDNFWGVVLFADISGFTAITKRLLKLGTEGLEFLKNNLSDYFDDLVSMIHEMGGDVISFSGDAVVAVWWSEDAQANSSSSSKSTERVRLAKLASQCALSIQKSLSNRRYQIGTVDELVLNMRVSVSASHLCGVHVGGVKGRWLFTAYGSAISDIAEAMVQCVIGEVIISASVWKLIKEFSVGEEVNLKFVKLNEIEAIQAPPVRVIEYLPEMADWMKLYISPIILSRLSARQEDFVGEFRTVTVLFICIHSINFQTTTKERIPPPLAKAFPHSNAKYQTIHNSEISTFAKAMRGGEDPQTLFEEAIEYADEEYESPAGSSSPPAPSLAPSPSASESPLYAYTIPKSNSASRIFVSYADGLDAFLDPAMRNTLQGSQHDTSDISRKLQLAVTTIQTELLNLEGDVNKLVADDKGLLAVAVFGLPPMSHEDDPLRGVLAAIAVRDQLNALNMECSIGVSTGKAFCGNYGSKGHNRKEYTVIGDSVNTAARLMQKSNKNILCDSASHKFATSKVWFESLEPITLKGYDQPVPIFKPNSVKIRNRKSEIANRQLFGRTKELDLLTKCATGILKSVAPMPRGSTRKRAPPDLKEITNLVVVEGDQGVGKTTLVDVMLQMFKGKRVKIVESYSDPYKNKGALHGIWPIFTQFLGLSKDVVSNRLRILSVVADNQNWMRLVPLLNKYLPLEFPANALCNELSENAKIESTIYLATQMLKVMAKEKPMVIVFENAQWLDRQSWTVLTDVVKRVAQVLVVVVMRPIAEPHLESLNTLKPNMAKIKLDLLDMETTLQIVLQHIGAKRFHPSISDVIFTRAQGNPLMCVEVAHYLLNSGIMVISPDGDCSLTTELDVESVDIPSSLEAMITARIDKLLPGPLLTLKVAAIIGKSFSFKLLESIYPIPDAKQELMENLLILRKLNILSFDETQNSKANNKLLEQVHGKVCYTFKDVLYMEVAYNLMLFAQKRALHEQVAKYYELALESIARNNHSKLFNFLIRHWEASGNKDKAQHYARRAIVVERWATLRKVLLSQRIVGRFLMTQGKIASIEK